MAPLTQKTRETKSETDRAKHEINRLRSTCDLYDAYIDEWNFFLSAYEGGRKFAKNKENIFRHQREHQDDYDDRVKRAHYLNYCKPLVDFPIDFIYQETIQRDGGNDKPFFNDFKLDVNRKGDDITSFGKDIAKNNRIFGMVWVLVDMPRVNGDTISKADEKRLGIRPYWVLVRPTEVLDWVIDSFEKLVYWKRKQIVEEFDFATSSKRILERYTEWSAGQIKVTDIDITEGENKPILGAAQIIDNQLGEVPVILYRYERSMEDRFMGKSFLTDLADNNLEIMNLTSLLQEFLYRQCFNMLAMAMDNDQDEEEQKQGEFGTSNVLEFPKDAAHVPQYVSPPVDPAKFLQDERARLVVEMYKRAAQDMVNELSNGNKASGFSKQFSFINAASSIASNAETLERGEMALMRLTFAWRRKEWTGKVKYKDNYQITNVQDSMAQLTTLFKDLQLQSETFLKAQLKRMVHETDGKLPSDVVEAVEAEIDKMDAEKYFETMQLALLGRAALAPEAAQADVMGAPKVAATAANPKEAAAQSAPGRPTAQRKTTQQARAAMSSKKPQPGGRKATS